MNEIKDIYKAIAKENIKQKIIVANATYEEVAVVKNAINLNLASFVLVGNKNDILDAADAVGLDPRKIEIIHETDHEKIMQILIEKKKAGTVDILMKGQIHTSSFMSALMKEKDFFDKKRKISQITLFDGLNGGIKLLSDCAINISPDFDMKVAIIKNAVELAIKIGIELPKVAILDAVETVNTKMPSTIEAAALTQMNKRGQIKGCIIDGPLSFDNALFTEYAKLKRIDSKVAGKADVLIGHDLGQTNNLSKSIIHYAKRPSASVIAGFNIPIVMTSRSDTIDNKLNTIIIQCYLTLNN